MHNVAPERQQVVKEQALSNHGWQGRWASMPKNLKKRPEISKNQGETAKSAPIISNGQPSMTFSRKTGRNFPMQMSFDAHNGNG